MAKNGTHLYCPKELLAETDTIKQTLGLFTRSEAMRKMVQYSRAGREMERLGQGLGVIPRGKRR